MRVANAVLFAGVILGVEGAWRQEKWGKGVLFGIWEGT